jgi:hypothetical protein
MRRTALLTLALLEAATVLAADEQRRGVPGGGICGVVVMYLICSRRKHEEIGGWLLYFYIQLYLGLIVTIVVTAISYDSYLPSAWAEAEPGLYGWFLLSTVPGVVLFPLELIAAEALRITRRARLRWVLIAVMAADLVMAIVGMAVDTAHFPDNIPLDVVTLIWPLVFIPYFLVSKRVKRVFVTRDWKGVPA